MLAVKAKYLDLVWLSPLSMGFLEWSTLVLYCTRIKAQGVHFGSFLVYYSMLSVWIPIKDKVNVL